MANVCFAHIKYEGFCGGGGNFCDFSTCGRGKKIKLKVICSGSEELWGQLTSVLLRDENNGAGRRRRRGRRLFLLSNKRPFLMPLRRSWKAKKKKKQFILLISFLGD